MTDQTDQTDQTDPTDPTGPGKPAEPPGCPRTEEAGSYLLGAVTPTERADYAAHLAGCAICQREVGELAGLPGLLARAPAPPAAPAADDGAETDAEPAGSRAPVIELNPPDPVPGALRAVRTHRIRRRLLTAATVVILAGAAFGGALALNRTPAGPGPVAPVALPVVLQPVGGTPVTATAGLTDRNWGTVVSLRCRFQEPIPGQTAVVVLVVRAADGSAQELARWTVRAGEEVNITSATDLRGAQLATMEVRTMAGSTVLRADKL